MMGVLTGYSPAVARLMEMFGLENVSSFAFSIAGPNAPAEITVTQQVSEEDALVAFRYITKRYRLVEIED